MKRQLQLFTGFAIAIAIVIIFYNQQSLFADRVENASTETLETFISRKASGEMLQVSGEVIKLLKDDNVGDRHQKFIIKVRNNTLLIVHNIDLALRVPVEIGDEVSVYGEYEWNDKGGLIHWTHRDKIKKHPDGWIEHKNKKYH